MNRITLQRLHLLLLVFLAHTPVFAQWTQTGYGVYGGSVRSTHSDGTVLLAGTSSAGIYVSANNGASWHVSNSGMPSEVANAFVSLAGKVFAATRYGIYVSANHGTTWSPSGLQDTYISCLSTSGSIIYAGCYGGPFRSIDNGATWTPIKTGLPADGVSMQAMASSGNSVFITDTNGQVFVSSDNGDHWTTSSVAGQIGYRLAINGTHVFAGTGGGLFHSPDLGAHWNLLGNAPPDAYSMMVSGGKLYISSNHSVFTSVDNGLTWSAGNDIGGGFIVSLTDAGSSILATTSESGVFQSTDNGTSWQAANNGLIRHGARSLLLHGGTLYAGTYFSVAKSTDGGATWLESTSGLSDASVTSLVAKGSLLLAGTGEAGVKVSADDGATWNPASTGLNNLEVSALVVSGANLFAGTKGGLYVSSNDGNLWSAVNAPFASPYILTVYADTDRIFVSTPLGLYYSLDQGAHWQSVNLTGINSIARLDDFLLAGSYDGLYQSDDDGVTWTRVASTLPTDKIITIAAAGNYVAISREDSDVLLYNGTSVISLTAGLPYDFSIPVFASDGTELLASLIPHYGNDRSGIFKINTSGIAIIRSMSPVKGIVGTVVTLEGTGFSPNPTSNLVQFNNRAARVLNASATMLQVVVPSTAGRAIVKTSVNGKTITIQTPFEVVPSITGIKPVKGYAGSTFTLYGTGFDEASNVTLNNVYTSTIVSNTSILVYTSIEATSGPVSLTSSDIQYPSPQGFEVLPLVTGFSPTMGAPGTFLQIDGTGFGDQDDQVTIDFNGTLATIGSRYALRMTTEVPEGATSGPITVKVNGNASISLSPFIVVDKNAFCTNPPPQPTIAVTEAGGTVTLVSSADIGNQWYRNGSAVPGAVSNLLHLTQPGIYTVRTRNGDCFSPYAESRNFSETVTGIREDNETHGLPIFPNPATRIVEIDLGALDINVPVSVSLYNSMGQRLVNLDGVGGNNLSIAVDGYPQGVYFVRARQSGRVIAGKFLKE